MQKKAKRKKGQQSSCWRWNSFTSNNSVGVEVVLGKANALSCGWVYDCGLNIQQSPAGVSCSAKGCSQLQCCSHSSIP